MKTPSPRFLLFDIESAGVNALKSDLGFVILFGYKWLGEKQARAITASRSDLRKFSDKRLLQEASKLFAEADLIVGHFASIFDRRFIQGRLLINNLPPIPPLKMRDTCLIARRVANFSSNRLKHLAKLLKFENQKLDNDWPNAWFRVMQGDMQALRGMATYCKGDVLALEELYLRLRPFDNAHPRIIDDRSACSVCGGQAHYRGTEIVGKYRYRRFQCKACGRWGHDAKGQRI